MKLKNQYFVLRHGESVGNVKKITADFPEKFYSPLTRKGKNKIKNLIKKLKKEKIDLIFSSDLLRCKQTAEILAKELKIKIKYDKRLREIDHGIFNGKPIKDRRDFWANLDLPNLTEFENFLRKLKIKFPKGENHIDVKKRVYQFIKEINKKERNKKILIISHAVTITMLDMAVNKLSYQEIFLDYKNENRIKPGECRKLFNK